MKIKLHVLYAWFLLLCIASIGQSQAQCPTAASFTPTVTAATCPSNGSIKLSNAADVPVTGGSGISGALYQITSGPASGGYQTTAQSANQFDGLPPGNYTISITKSGCPTVTVTVTVANQYTPLALNATVSGVCSGTAAITANTTGGNTPITYTFLKTTNANTPDAGLTYGSASTFQANAATGGYGTYLVRAKDQCGVFTTVMVDVVATSAPAAYTPNFIDKLDCSTYKIVGTLVSGSNTIDPAVAPGYKVEIFDVTGNVPSPCAVPGGATPIKTVTINSAGDLGFNLPTTAKQLVIRTTSPCGDVTINCYDTGSHYSPAFTVNSSASCNVDAMGTNRVILNLIEYQYTFPIQVVVKNKTTGAVISTQTWSSGDTFLNEVDYLAGGYDVTITDACGLTKTQTIIPASAATPTTTGYVTVNSDCAGNRVSVYLDGGKLGLLNNGSTYVLVSGPSGPYTPPLAGAGNNYGEIYWYNLAPGNYTGQIVSTTSGCGPTSFTFTVPPSNNPALIFNLSGSTTLLCGGTGTINAVLNYNGTAAISFDLLDANGTVLATKSNATFANLPAGTYTVKAYGVDGCGVSISTTKQYTILPAGSPPVITKKVGITCEDGNTQLATGQALFEFNGVAPFLLEMKPTGTSTWTTQASGLNTNTYTVSNLNANATYDVRLTDNCGNSTVTTVSIKPLEAQSVTNTAQPCVNQPYTLSAPDFPNATYSWTRGGSVISTAREIPFASFSASDNGTYVCTLTIGGCLVRTITVTLNSNNCGLPVSLTSFTAKAIDNRAIQLDWTTATERNNDYFLLERSKDLLVFEAVTNVKAREGVSAQGNTYSYTDEQPYQGTSYYRLRQVDFDGTSTTFKAVSVILRAEAYGVFPNPVRDGQFTLQLDEPQTAVVKLYTADGRPVSLHKTGNTDSSLHLKASQPLPTGVYVLTVAERGQVRQYRIIIN